jgi:hypothetical protein
MQEVRPGVWRLRVYAGRRPNGSPIQVRKTVYGGVRIAERELAKLVNSVDSGKIVADVGTFGELLDRWLEHCEALGRSPTTLREYRRIAEKVIRPDLGRLKLSKLTAAHLDRLYQKLTENGAKPATVRRVHALIGASLHIGRGHGQRGFEVFGSQHGLDLFAPAFEVADPARPAKSGRDLGPRELASELGRGSDPQDGDGVGCERFVPNASKAAG